jgi:hypothetical protein
MVSGAHANHCCDSSSRRQSENSGVSRATLAGAAGGPGRLQIAHPTGMVLNTAEKPAPDSCASAWAIPTWNPLGVWLLILNPRCGPFLGRSAPQGSHKTPSATLRPRRLDTPQCREPRLFYLSAPSKRRSGYSSDPLLQIVAYS